MAELFDSWHSVLMVLVAVFGAITAMQRQPGFRLIGIGMALVAITSLTMGRSAESAARHLVLQSVGSLGGLACMGLGIRQLGQRTPPDTE